MSPEERFEAWWVNTTWASNLSFLDSPGEEAAATAAYLAGFTAGAEDMRERAAKEIERKKTRINGQLHAALVRALPTEPPTPDDDYGPGSEAQRLYDEQADAPPLDEELIERIVRKVCDPRPPLPTLNTMAREGTWPSRKAGPPTQEQTDE